MKYAFVKKETILGSVLALVTVMIAAALPEQKAVDLFVLLLVFISSVYLGFALSDGRRRALIIEILGLTLFLSLALLGLWSSPLYLAVGYFAHGVWDILHHPRALQTRVVTWWPPLCLVYDWIVGGFILFRFH